MRLLLQIAAFIIAMSLCAVAQAATDRVALIIGNSAYSHVPKLPNPANDAKAIALAFEALGFDVTRANDMGFDGLRRALRDFTAKAASSQMAVIYYAGHGMEVNKENYLIPVDAKLLTDRDIAFEALPMDMLTQAVAGAGLLKLVILDACRNNPFAAEMKVTSAKRTIGRGLVRFDPAPGTLVAYAAQEGAVASDGDGANSPYAAALVKNLSEPGLEINFLFRRVRDSVMEETDSKQQPFTYGSLPGREIYLSPPSDTGTSALNTPSVSPDVTIEIAYWNSVKDSGDRELLEGYLARYPEGLLSTTARKKLASLNEKIQTEEEAKPDKAPERVAAGKNAEIASRFTLNGLTVGSTASEKGEFIRWDQEWTFPGVTWVKKLDNGHIAYATESDNESGRIIAIAKSFVTKNIETKDFYEMLSNSFGKWDDFSSYKSDPY